MTNTAPTATSKIIMRDDPCGCGCEGRDPWHAKTIRRVVRDVSDWTHHRTGDDGLIREVSTGTIRVQWGEEKVARIRYVDAATGAVKHVGGWTRASLYGLAD